MHEFGWLFDAENPNADADRMLGFIDSLVAKPTAEFFENYAILDLPALADFDDAYPDVENEAIARNLKTVEVFRRGEFITSIDVVKHSLTSALYGVAQDFVAA